jgi:hypothetical protein
MGTCNDIRQPPPSPLLGKEGELASKAGASTGAATGVVGWRLIGRIGLLGHILVAVDPLLDWERIFCFWASGIGVGGAVCD